jgi:hypothetical protein
VSVAIVCIFTVFAEFVIFELELQSYDINSKTKYCFRISESTKKSLQLEDETNSSQFWLVQPVSKLFDAKILIQYLRTKVNSRVSIKRIPDSVSGRAKTDRF